MFVKVETRNTWPLMLLAINAIGAFCYVLLASRAWVIPQECSAGIHVTTGEPFVWFVSVAPVIAIFLLINLAWGNMILWRRRWHLGRMWLAAAAIWAIAAVIDFARHQC